LETDSQTVNDFGKPDAGKPLVRFDEGRELILRAYSTSYGRVKYVRVGRGLSRACEDAKAVGGMPPYQWRE
jgi:hypothetical protein